jgi:hypothetical protein
MAEKSLAPSRLGPAATQRQTAESASAREIVPARPFACTGSVSLAWLLHFARAPLLLTLILDLLHGSAKLL